MRFPTPAVLGIPSLIHLTTAIAITHFTYDCFHHTVLGIPSLVILRPDGTVANRNARAALSADKEGLKFPWVGEEDRGLGMGVMPVVAILLLVLMWWYFNNN